MKILLVFLVLATLVSCRHGRRLDSGYFDELVIDADFDEIADGNDLNYDGGLNFGNRQRYSEIKLLERSRDGKSVIIRFTDRSLGTATNTTISSGSDLAKPGEEQLWAVDLSNFDNTQSMWDYIQDPANRTRVFMVNPNTFGGTYLSDTEARHTMENWVLNQDGSGTPDFNVGLNPTRGLFVDVDGNLYETSSDSPKDLETAGAKFESLEVAQMEDMLISYGLSTERAEEVAKLANAYKKIVSKRALNSRERDMFTKELLGVPFNQAAKDMVMDYDGLLERAAELNETSPEAIRELLNEVM